MQRRLEFRSSNVECNSTATTSFQMDRWSDTNPARSSSTLFISLAQSDLVWLGLIGVFKRPYERPRPPPPRTSFITTPQLQTRIRLAASLGRVVGWFARNE